MPATISGLAQVAIPAKDLARASAFYKKLGLKHLFDAPPGLSFFDCGGVRLMVEVPSAPEFAHRSSILYFRVADIEGDFARLKDAGVAFRDTPHRVAKLPDREIWMCFFEDSEGNVHALTAER